MSQHQQPAAVQQTVDEQGALQNIVEAPEPISGLTSRAASHPTLVGLDNNGPPSPATDSGDLKRTTSPPGYAAHHEHDAHPPAARRPHDGRRNSTVSHVDVDFFDPSGVHELKRTLTHQKGDENQGAEELRRAEEDEGAADVASVSTDATLKISDDGHFDFEKTLKKIIRKCVNLTTSSCPLS